MDVIEYRSEKNKELEESLRKEERNEKRIKLGKKILKITLIVILVISFIFILMHYVGTKGLVVKEYKVESNKLPTEFHGFKIVQFSDLHYLTTMKNKEVKKIVNKINEINPDIVVFTGDLIAENKEITKDQIDFLTKQLNKINSKLGKFAVKGNEDYNKNYDAIMNKTDFKIINNSYEVIYYNGTTPILLTGSGSILKNDSDVNKAFSYNDLENVYTISLIHEPDVTDNIISYNPDLILAGHSHNGQIRLPLIGGLVKFDEAKKYNNPKYNLDDTTLFISGGLGTSKYEFRLFNHPSINFYRLVKGTN